MNQTQGHIAFYRQMILLLRNALDLLDEQGQIEVFRFLTDQQNTDGGFKDRGGRSDLYYSLFGAMMLKARKTGDRKPEAESEVPFLELVEGNPATKLKQFILCQSEIKIPGFIEQCCLALLQKEFNISRWVRGLTLVKLSCMFWKERFSINLSYRSFVLFLTLDAVLPFRNLLQRFSGKMLLHVEVNEHSPCSEIAAKVFLLKMLRKDGSKEQHLLMSFAYEAGGFRAFQHMKQADMLSTAVSLFALKNAGCDLRLLKPTCLDFIEQNFSNGAFLSGDGDPTADIEYTFYGLLALGVLAD